MSESSESSGTIETSASARRILQGFDDPTAPFDLHTLEHPDIQSAIGTALDRNEHCDVVAPKHLGGNCAHLRI